MNTKYISSSGVKKISIFHECVALVKMLIFSRVRSTSENADIFTAGDEIYLVFAEKRKFLFLFYANRNTESKT